MSRDGQGFVVSRPDLVAGLRGLGLCPGSGLMVHSSLGSLGFVEGGAQAVIDALMDVVTPSGTLLMPSFNHGAAFAEGQPGRFNPGETPTTNGAIPEAFWRRPGVYRSIHPTHSFAAWGRHAQRYTAYHHRTLTMGPGSPLGLLQADSGFCLLLGVGYGRNSFHHVVEMSTGAPCLGRRTTAYPVMLADGRMVEGRAWSWRERPCPLTDGGHYGDLMRAGGWQKEGTIGSSRLILFRLADCYTVVSGLLREGRDEHPPCHRCPTRPRINKWTVPSDWDEEGQCLRPDSVAWSY